MNRSKPYNKSTCLQAGCAALLLTVTLTGCNGQELPTNVSNSPASDTEQSQPSVEIVQGNRIEPIPSGLSIETLDNCTVAASFENSDVAMDDGALTIHLTAYNYELFDMVDLAGMQEGDTLVLAGQELPVLSVEHNENGVAVNSGVGAGGVSFAPEGGGAYCETMSDCEVVRHYLPLGEITLPVDQEMTYYDNTSSESRTYYAGDLLALTDTVDFSCTAQNCSVVIANGHIMSMTRGAAVENER